jgi:dihydroorotate dehydrogenase
MQISFCAEAAASLAAAADALNLYTSFLQNEEEDCRKINNLLKYIG